MCHAKRRYEGNAATLNSFNDTGRSAPISRDRRRVLGGIAASCAGLAGTVIGSSNPLPPFPAATQAALRERQAPCGRSQVVTSDEATVVEISAGRVRGFKRNGVYIFKGVPYGASTSGANRFMPPMKPEPWSGIRNALQYGRVCPSQDSAHFNTDGKNLSNTADAGTNSNPGRTQRQARDDAALVADPLHQAPRRKCCETITTEEGNLNKR